MTNEIANEKLWNQNFIFTSLANFFAFTAMYYIMSTLPLFTTEVFGGSNRDVGILFGLFALAGVIARPCAGYMLDTLGRKKIAWLSLVALLVAMFLYNLAVSLLFLLVLRIIHGIGWGFSTTTLATMATDAIPVKKRGEGIGYFGLSMSLAMLIGPSLGLAVLHAFGYSSMFWAGTCLAAVALLCLIGVKHHATTAMEHQRQKGIIEKKVLADAAILFFVAIVYSAVLSFIVLFAQEIKVENSGLFFLANAATVIISRPYAGKIMDQKGPVEIMCVGFGTLCATFICLFFANDYILFLAAALLLGVGFGIVFSLSITLAINQVDMSRRGMVNGTMLTAFDLGFALGSALLGLVSTYTGLRLMYLISGALVIIPFAIFYIKYILKAKPATVGEA